MELQSPAHEESYRLACRAVAHARREAYRTAAGMTTTELCACEPAYRAATGIGPDVPVTEEALTQLRMVSSLVARRASRLAWPRGRDAR